MATPKKISEEVAKLMVVHQKHSKVATKARYADELHRYVQYPGPKLGVMQCGWCQMPILEYPPRDCACCSIMFPCYGPFCVPLQMDTINNTCAECGLGILCPMCIEAEGCINCGKTCCRECALVCVCEPTLLDHAPITLTLCNESCIRQTAKRAKTAPAE